MERSTENRENGDATHQELNGCEHKEEMPSEEKSKVLTTNSTNNITTERCAPVQSDTTVELSDQSEKTEPAVTNTANNDTNLSQNNTTNEVPKNGNGEFEELKAVEQDLQKSDVTTASVETSTEKRSTLADTTNELLASTNGEEIHQNGDNIDQEIVKQSKAQIEVNSKTENKDFAATLDSFPSISINPSNAQIHSQELNTSAKNIDEHFKTIVDQSVISKPTDTESVTNPIIPTSSISESVEGTDYNIQIEKSIMLTTETIETEGPVRADKINELSPPPLPISPPPSQVSVFLFTNNEESLEKSVPINSIKPEDSTFNEESKEILLNTTLEPRPDNTSLETDIPENNQSLDEKNNICDEFINEIVENKSIEEIESVEENVFNNNLTDTSKNDEETSIAAAVITEIIENAAEIVSRHSILKENESLPSTELTEDSNNETENDVKNVDHNELAEGINVAKCRKDKLTEYSIEPTVDFNQTIDSITDNSLTFSPKDSTQAQNEMITLSVE